jgi:alpha-L-fucosidase
MSSSINRRQLLVGATSVAAAAATVAGDVLGAGPAQAAPSTYTPDRGSVDQQWRITHRGDDRHSITDRSTGMVLHGAGDVAPGSVAEQWAYNSSTNLLWTFTAP